MIQSLSRQVFQDPFVKLNVANTNNYEYRGGGGDNRLGSTNHYKLNINQGPLPINTKL